MLNARVDWKNNAHGETYHPQSTIEPSWRRSVTQSHNNHVTSSFWSPGLQNAWLPGDLDEARVSILFVMTKTCTDLLFPISLASKPGL